MNVLLQQLERDGVVTRPSVPSTGRTLPAHLTPHGRAQLKEASEAVRSVELKMLDGMSPSEQGEAFRILQRMIHGLQSDVPEPGLTH